MANCQKFEIPKIDYVEKPSIKQLKEFGAQFNKNDWEYICYDRKFMNSILTNLEEARKIANSLLKIENPS